MGDKNKLTADGDVWIDLRGGERAWVVVLGLGDGMVIGIPGEPGPRIRFEGEGGAEHDTLVLRGVGRKDRPGEATTAVLVLGPGEAAHARLLSRSAQGRRVGFVRHPRYGVVMQAVSHLVHRFPEAFPTRSSYGLTN